MNPDFFTNSHNSRYPSLSSSGHRSLQLVPKRNLRDSVINEYSATLDWLPLASSDARWMLPTLRLKQVSRPITRALSENEPRKLVAPPHSGPAQAIDIRGVEWPCPLVLRWKLVDI